MMRTVSRDRRTSNGKWLERFAHDDDIAGLGGDVGPRADGDADTGSRQRRRVVDAIADERGGSPPQPLSPPSEPAAAPRGPPSPALARQRSSRRPHDRRSGARPAQCRAPAARRAPPPPRVERGRARRWHRGPRRSRRRAATFARSRRVDPARRQHPAETGMPVSSSNRRVPTTTALPSTVAETPPPGWAWKSATSGSDRPRSAPRCEDDAGERMLAPLLRGCCDSQAGRPASSRWAPRRRVRACPRSACRSCRRRTR